MTDVRTLEVKVVARVGDVDAAEWDACAGADPFMSHAFLSALEETDCATAKHGWLPQHLVVSDERGVVAAVPAYLKGHSFGEYVFDWGWADAYRRAGQEYYPKLQACVPFTPVTGARVLVRQDADPARYRGLMLSALVELARRHGASGVHVTFPSEPEWSAGKNAGLLPRIGVQYHWFNKGYGRFDDFLGDLLGRKKRQIVRERRDAAAGSRIEVLRGGDIKKRDWDAFYGFYTNTIDRKWGSAYLTRAFFARIADTMKEKLVLMVAKDGDDVVAAALNVLGHDALFGRYWGACVDRPFLHFELCYYRAIDLAIELGLARVEAGAQGEHKIARGYLPVETYSLHWLAEPRFASAVADFLARETPAVRAEIEELRAQSPYRAERGLALPDDTGRPKSGA